MSRPPVPLPSIRDIFPEISAHPNHTKPFGAHPTTQDRTLPNPPSPARPRTANRCGDSPITSCFHVAQPPPSPPPSSSSSDSAPIRPNALLQHLPSGAPKPPPSYSFNVLRTDPITASLEHVASSTTLRHRGAAGPQPGVVNGSAPVFRVAIAPPDPRAIHHQVHHKRPAQEMLAISDPRDRHSNRDFPSPTTGLDADSSMLSHHPSSSSILSFSVTDPPNSASTVMNGNDGRRYLRSSEIVNPSLQGEGRGKKHQCPHCGKRFNRPSSMKIHVNTHTGAKPYRCPFPGCGREFNVNSNMRRHWRNHSRSGPPPISTRLTAEGGGDDGSSPSMYRHHPRSGSAEMDILGHGSLGSLGALGAAALMSPPATNSSMSDGEDEEDEEDEEMVGSRRVRSVYQGMRMDVDDDGRGRRMRRVRVYDERDKPVDDEDDDDDEQDDEEDEEDEAFEEVNHHHPHHPHRRFNAVPGSFSSAWSRRRTGPLPSSSASSSSSTSPPVRGAAFDSGAGAMSGSGLGSSPSSSIPSASLPSTSAISSTSAIPSTTSTSTIAPTTTMTIPSSPSSSSSPTSPASTSPHRHSYARHALPPSSSSHVGLSPPLSHARVDGHRGHHHQHHHQRQSYPHHHHHHHHHGDGRTTTHHNGSSSSSRAIGHTSTYGHGHRHGHGHDSTPEYIYRPSIPAYERSCTDLRVSTALRPAFRSESAAVSATTTAGAGRMGGR